jgi:squalene synthase HpnC
MRAFLFMIPNFTFTDLSDLSCTSHGGRFAVDTVEQALKFCESIAKSHYENFPVASLLLPTSIRSHVMVIYAFSRIADDIADEFSLEYGKEKAEHALAIMHHFVKQSHVGGYKGKNPLWIALQHMFEKTSLPIAPFERLLNAFLSDVYFQFPSTMSDLLEYCHNSANPIGELLLRLFGFWNTDIQKESDSLCSALQIINFIQDISIDRSKHRFYVPLEYLDSHEIVENYLAVGEITPNFSSAVSRLILDADSLMRKSKILPWKISNKGLRTELLLIHCSGQRILRKCKNQELELPLKRPKLEFMDYVVIFLQMLIFMPMIVLKR